MIEYAYILFQCMLAVIGGVLFLAVPALIITEGIMQYSKYKDRQYIKRFKHVKKQSDISCPFE